MLPGTASASGATADGSGAEGRGLPAVGVLRRREGHTRDAHLLNTGQTADSPIVGVVLAGGAGRRLRRGAQGAAASSKAATPLAGRPLIAYPLEALAEVCDRVAVICKRGTALPEIGAAERWNEPEQPRHPLTGIVHALARAGGPVLVCAADMPFVTPAACSELIAAATVGAPDGSPSGRRDATATAVVGVGDAGLEPLLGVYSPATLPALRAAATDAPLRATIESLDPVRLELPGSLLRSVNTPEDLTAAATELGHRGT